MTDIYEDGKYHHHHKMSESPVDMNAFSYKYY